MPPTTNQRKATDITKAVRKLVVVHDVAKNGNTYAYLEMHLNNDESLRVMGLDKSLLLLVETLAKITK